MTGPIVAAALSFAQGSHAADPIIFDPDGPGSVYSPITINAFDWLPGNALAVGAVPLSTGLQFNLHYQAELARILTSGGSGAIPIPTGPDPSFEITASAQIPETVNSAINLIGNPDIPDLVVFDTRPGGFFRIYYDNFSSGVNANDATSNPGAGYSDGVLILEGHIVGSNLSGNYTLSDDTATHLLDQFGSNNLGAVNTLRGQGNSQIKVVVSFAHPDWFPTPPKELQINFDSTLSTPFDSINPSVSVAGRAPFYGANNTNGAYAGGAPEDFHFEADSNNSFEVPPCVELQKQVSVDAGLTWFDADTAADAPTVTFPHGALYRLIVRNCGMENLRNVVVNDPALGIADHAVGNLAIGEEKVLTQAEIPALEVQERCNHSGTFINVADVDGQSVDTGATVSDSDPAVLICVGEPAIDIVKEISVDGGLTWFDANSAATAPSVTFPHGALYRLIVRNVGTVDLQNVVINDAVLGIADYAVGNLVVGAEVILTEAELPALNVATRCSGSGTFTNVADVTGQSVETGAAVSDSDPAVMNCIGEPSLELLKQISVDGGLSFFDADTAATAPTVTFPHGALYRLIVRNVGTIDLQNVVVNDPTLGVVNYAVGNLAVGEEKGLTQAEIPALEVQERCNHSGTFTNVADVTGQSADTGATVSDSDPAVLICVGEPAIELIKQISVDGGASFEDADTAVTAPTVTFPHGALYRLIVRNVGTIGLQNVVVNDPTLGIVNYAVGNLAVGEENVLTQAEIPALEVQERCNHSGTFTNVADVTGQSADTGATVSDSDPAVLICIGEPAIDIVKEISVDGGLTWFDANTAATAPSVTFPHGALYRLIVRNVGTVDLQNVVVNDAVLGIANYAVGNLVAGAEVILSEGEIPALNVATRCDNSGTFTNVADVSGQSVGTGASVSDSDPAVLVCVPPDAPGTGTPGYWMNHPEAWPVDQITIGGVMYTREEAIALMFHSTGGDVTYIMFQTLVAAKLNVLVGNESSCIADGVTAADAWMATYGPVGSGVKAGGKNSPWKAGEPLKNQLDAYNNGLLCAPHRN
ncbi:hypothetical protein sS8_4026 [Methylocaldum marinum]|uniref:DUF11 domain-containing protein n=1 Tax=Methylocaldum marinum TaxID=1432792 RepID=A0A250KWG3_9GAMM|nr:hypothetical protein sS8_4026 [Methylocaldum marinum]